MAPQKDKSHLEYGPLGDTFDPRGIKMSRWILYCQHLQLLRRQRKRQVKLESLAIALGYRLSTLFKRWRQKVCLRRKISDILRRSIKRWVLCRWKLRTKTHYCFETIKWCGFAQTGRLCQDVLALPP